MPHNNTRRILTLGFAYFDEKAKAEEHAKRARALREQILNIAQPGRYGRYTIFKVKKAKIHVRAYVRTAYYGITQRKQHTNT
jgi:hypothetical protein